MPAELFAQVPVVFEGEGAQWSRGRDGYKHGGRVGSAKGDAGNERTLYRAALPGLQARKPVLAPHRTHREQHRIRRRNVVETSFTEVEERDRHNVHPRKHAIARATEVEN